MKIKISKGNSKIGKIPNISTVPIKDCINCNSCKKVCYAMKAYKQYTEVKNAWNNNSKVIRQAEKKNNYSQIITDIDTFIKTRRNPANFFRFHVAGDVLYQGQLDAYNEICKLNSDVKFLMFTKNFTLNYDKLAKNFKVVFSVFKGMEDQEIPKGSIAYTGDTKKIRKGQIFECAGNCNDCMVCWSFHKNQHVHFNIH